MPPVGKRARKGPRKSAPKKLRAKKKATPAPASYGHTMVQRVGMAGGAGLVAVLLIGAALLWSGGVIGRIGEDVTRSAGQSTARAMIAAGFDIRRITVVGRDKTSHYAIENALGPVTGMSLMHFSPDEARARIEQIGWVRSAAVSRLWPNQINISIRERTPAALWQVAGSLRLVDHGGAIIREIGAYEYTDLPMIVGVGAPEAAAGILAVLDEVGLFDGRITALVRVSDRRWNLRLGNEMDVKLPETGYGQAVRDLAVLHEAVGVLERNFEYIDLRDPERAFFHCHGAAQSDNPPLNVLSGEFYCDSPALAP